jgi:hypothetical protein
MFGICSLLDDTRLIILRYLISCRSTFFADVKVAVRSAPLPVNKPAEEIEGEEDELTRKRDQQCFPPQETSAATGVESVDHTSGHHVDPDDYEKRVGG